MAQPRASILQLAGMNGAFEPQRAFQWLFTIQGLSGADVLELALRSVSLPNPTVEEIEIPFMNSSVFVPGRTLPSEATLTFNDYLDKDVAGIIARWHKQTANTMTGQIGYAKLIKREATLTLFSPDFSEERVWLLEGVWCKDVTFGELAYDSSEVVQVEVTIRYDRAHYGETDAPGLGDLASSVGF